MARVKHNEIVRRTVTPSREGAQPELVVHADQDSARGYQGLSRVTVAALGSLSNMATRMAEGRAAEKTDMGAMDRMSADLGGTPALDSEGLQDQNRSYRRGYLKADAAIRVRDWQTDVVTVLSQAEPGTDVEKLLQEKSAELMALPEFQDPAVRQALLPALAKAQDNARASWQKMELGEIFTRQHESFTELARQAWQDGTLLTNEGRESFYSMMDREEFAYLSRNEVDEILASTAAEVLASGSVDPDAFIKSLEQQRGDGSPGLMNSKHGDALRQAASFGAAARDKQYAEAQSQWLADTEFTLRDMISKGQYSRQKITEIADGAGLAGSKRLTFLRHWDNQWAKELRSRRTAAASAKQHAATLELIQQGMVHSMTNSEINKAAEREWKQAVLDGNTERQYSIIQEVHKAGGVVPQIRDMLSRTTKESMSNDYQIFEMLTRVDQFAADRYMTDETAVLLSRHHDNITRFGMSPQESIALLPSGKDKGRRPEAEARVARVASSYFKDNPEMPDGTERPEWLETLVQQQAARLMLNNPEVESAEAMKLSDRMARGYGVVVKGKLVPRGGASDATVPAIEKVVDKVEADLIKDGKLDEVLKGSLYAAPHRDDPNLFVVTLPTGVPLFNESTGLPYTFDAIEFARVSEQYEMDRAEAEVRHNASKSKGFTPRTPQSQQLNPGDLLTPEAADGPGYAPFEWEQPKADTKPSKGKFKYPDLFDYYLNNK